MPSYNKVILGDGTVVIDLTNDRVLSNKMIYGSTAHAASGEIISGSLFQNYPDTETIIDDIHDSSNDLLFDSSSSHINVEINYILNKFDTYPDTTLFIDEILDSSNENVSDSSSVNIGGGIVYVNMSIL